MPFGLNIAPLSFTRLTKSILKELCLKGIQVLVYLDDWLIWAPSASQCTAAQEIALSVIQKRGFLINWAKCPSFPSPSHQDRHLTVSSLVSLPPSCVEEGFIESNGEASVCFHSVPHLQTSSQGSQFVSEGSCPGPSSRQEVSSTPTSPQILEEMVPSVPSQEAGLLEKTSPSFDVHTDASMSGWGFHTSDGRSRSGLWSPQFRRLHINILELATVYIAINSSSVAVPTSGSTATTPLRSIGST